jgi:hypothetical protein
MSSIDACKNERLPFPVTSFTRHRKRTKRHLGIPLIVRQLYRLYYVNRIAYSLYDTIKQYPNADLTVHCTCSWSLTQAASKKAKTIHCQRLKRGGLTAVQVRSAVSRRQIMDNSRHILGVLKTGEMQLSSAWHDAVSHEAIPVQLHLEWFDKR